MSSWTSSCLLWISLLAGIGSASAAGPAPFLPAEEGVRAQYTVTIGWKQARISGICIMKSLGSEIVGALVNEFGIRAFDFRYDPRRKVLKIENTIGFLDRWYIRKGLRSDLRALFRAADGALPCERGCRRIDRLDDGSLQLENRRRGLCYRFSPMAPVRKAVHGPEQPGDQGQQEEQEQQGQQRLQEIREQQKEQKQLRQQEKLQGQQEQLQGQQEIPAPQKSLPQEP